MTAAGQAAPAGAAAHAPVAVCTLDEARQLLRGAGAETAPAAARRLREAGSPAACIVNVNGPDGRLLHWLDSEHAQGWLAPAAGSGRPDSRAFAGQLDAAGGKGFVAADAAVLATMATTAPAGPGAAASAFVNDPAVLPQLSWSEVPRFSAGIATAPRRLDLYAIVDSAARLAQVLDAGVRTVQLRIKKPSAPDAAWHAMLRREVQQSVSACADSGAELFVNDHWQLAAELGAPGVHLGQEDLLALGDAGRAALQATGLALGVSSHSLWELCRARALAPRYIARGPVWPTLTKAMPWRPQGLDNLSWWCRMAQVPVVAIGGILGVEDVMQAAACGADGVCIVRGLGDQPQRAVPALRQALEAGRRAAPPQPPAWPHPSLAGT